YNSPKKILDNCAYAVTGDQHGAAITATGELYTWGLNILGGCGVETGEDDYVRIPTKVLDDVSMVWVEALEDRKYDFNIFAKLNDGTILAAGMNLGEKEKSIETSEELAQPSIEIYADSFVPINAEDYSKEAAVSMLNELQWGSSMAEVEEILSRNKMEYYKTLLPVEGTDDELVEKLITIDDNSYLLYFDDNKCLYQIDIQIGQNRNGKFSIGMTLEEVKASLNCELVQYKNAENNSQIYRTSEPIDRTYYAFVFESNEEFLSKVIESNK
ncbi:MAG: hypothetical protein K6G30_10150, partial [Acetatifactor sp.]|nr:hypothetical protein [Acetatifactor sp.]